MNNVNSQNKDSRDILQTILQQSLSLLQEKSFINQIKRTKQHSQNKIYHLFTSDKNVYFQAIWTYLINDDPQIQEVVLDSINLRFDSVFNDIIQNKISIEQRQPLLPYDYEDQYKHSKLNSLKYQSSRLKRKINQINENIDDFPQRVQKQQHHTYDDLYSKEKRKQAEEYRKNLRKEQIERKKKNQQKRKKQEQIWIKKQQEIKNIEEKKRKQKFQQLLKIQKQKHQQRQKQKQIRQRRNSQYINFKKIITQKPPLYRKIQNNYSKRYQSFQQDIKQKATSQRKYLVEPVQLSKIQQHKKKYLQIKQLRQRERIQRINLIQEQEKSRIIYHSSFQLPKQIDYKQKEQIQKQKVRSKMAKIKEYKSMVKQKFAPKIDENKRKQLMNLIQEIELGNKKVKKIILPNGSIVYQQLKDTDGKILGIQYLEKVKQMAKKQKNIRKKSQQFNTQLQIKKDRNYLNELRQQRIKKGQNKHGFLVNKNISYDQKVKKIMLESEKKSQQTKQAQMKLKYGKFKTSQQILACKQQIDKNYIDIVNMKLKLIQNQSQD